MDVDKFKFTPRIQRLNELEVCSVTVRESYDKVTVTGFEMVYNNVKIMTVFVSGNFVLERCNFNLYWWDVPS